MGTGDIECQNQIQGKLTEALWTSIFLSAISLFEYLKGKSQVREFFTGNGGKMKFEGSITDYYKTNREDPNNNS